MTTISREIQAKVRELETLHADLLQVYELSEIKVGCLRYAFLRDETAILMQRAEECLPAAALHRLQSRVNRGCATRWQVYRQGPHLIKELTGKQLWEHPKVTMTIGEVFRPNEEEQREE